MRLIKITPKKDYSLFLEYDDGVKWKISLKNKLSTIIFSPLKDYSLFSKAKLNKFWSAIIWNNKIDMDAANCYYKITNTFTQ